MGMQPILEEINLFETTNEGGAGLEVGPTYLVLYRGHFHTGRFNKVWHGLVFCGGPWPSLQYDPPGTNGADWQKAWRIVNAGEIAAEDELRYATAQRDYAAAHGCTHKGMPIPHDAPVEAFYYTPKCEPVKVPDDDDDDED